jgi:RNA polymerase-interacting CarD/CdnL/TRCF family regulator
MFSTGSKVVFQLPGTWGTETRFGVGEVRGHADAGGEGQTVQVLDLATQKTFQVPVTDSVLRGVVTREEVDAVLDALNQPSHASKDGQTWNRIYRDLTSRFKSGVLIDSAEAFRDLNHLLRGGEASWGDACLLSESFALLVAEIALVQNRPTNEVAEQIKILVPTEERPRKSPRERTWWSRERA